MNYMNYWALFFSCFVLSVFANPQIDYLCKESPEHASFSSISLLVEKGAYQEALQRSIRLKEQMGKEESYLYFHNLLRIAVLQKHLQNGPGELAAWKDCEEFLGWQQGAVSTPFSEQILSFYQERNIDLRGYILRQIEVCSLSVCAK